MKFIYIFGEVKMNKFIHGFLSAAAAAVFCFITVFTGCAPPTDGPDSAAVVSYCIAGRSREVDGGKVSYDKITVARYIYCGQQQYTAEYTAGGGYGFLILEMTLEMENYCFDSDSRLNIDDFHDDGNQVTFNKKMTVALSTELGEGEAKRVEGKVYFCFVIDDECINILYEYANDMFKQYGEVTEENFCENVTFYDRDITDTFDVNGNERSTEIDFWADYRQINFCDEYRI